MAHQKQEVTIDELLEKIKFYIKNEKEQEMIQQAYLFAKEKHEGQFRKSGEAYIAHPLNVAYILSEIHADSKTIEAALLHDTIEDCDVTKEEIENAKQCLNEIIQNTYAEGKAKKLDTLRKYIKELEQKESILDKVTDKLKEDIKIFVFSPHDFQIT